MRCEALSCKTRVISLIFFLIDSTHSWAKPPKNILLMSSCLTHDKKTKYLTAFLEKKNS